MTEIIADYKRIIGGAYVAGSVSELVIATAESRLAVSFPKPYRNFLANYGAVMGSGFDIAGLFETSSDEPPLWRDVVQETERIRAAMNGNFPTHLVPVCSDGCSTTYCIESRNSQGDATCLIVAWGPDVESEIVATMFEEFVINLAN